MSFDNKIDFLWKLSPLGLGTIDVYTRASARIDISSPIPFKVLWLSTKSTGFMIDNIVIRERTQFVAIGAIPSEYFASNELRFSLRGDILLPGEKLGIYITNNNPNNAAFTGVLYGLIEPLKETNADQWNR